MVRDARQAVVQAVIEGEYASFMGKRLVWSQRDRKSLNLFLARNPKVFSRQIVQMIRNWFAIQNSGSHEKECFLSKLFVHLSFIKQEGL